MLPQEEASKDERKADRTLTVHLETPGGGVFCRAICSWLLLTAFGYPANEAFVSLWDATFGNLRVFGNTLNKACPLLFTGIAVAIPATAAASLTSARKVSSSWAVPPPPG